MEERCKKTDEAMEAQFGKPDYSKAFINPENGLLYIPLGDGKLVWRIENEAGWWRKPSLLK